ncbi:hypothetical protein FSPOR_11005 [Fusarium sporotrichioides]|uniref:Mid2 domain-containing protein n=1 Tax=Fusarium sporotrichioides TaxID=5514 RepID=A0A395RII2_FUSSP|nr:hypothetical protein FSPOR_11005 [Fusarium sporotrichioides]
MENHQGPVPDGTPTSPPQHKNKARSYVDVTGKLYNTVPTGWTPVVTVEGWTNVYTESGKPVTAKRNQLTIIEEIPTITAASEETSPSESSRPGWGWVTESSTYTIDIQTQSSSTDDPTTTSESTTHETVSDPYRISLVPVIPWWSKTYVNTFTESVTITESSRVTTTSDTTFLRTTSSTLPTSNSTIWPPSTASSIPEASSASTMEWVGIIVGSVCGFVLTVIFILSMVFRGSRPKTPSRENQNNINIRLDNGPFRNRPLAENNPGCVPEGWDDIRV